METSEIIKLIVWVVPLVIIFSLIWMLIFADKDKSNRVPKPKSKKAMRKRISELETDVKLLERFNESYYKQNKDLEDRMLALELELNIANEEKDKLIVDKHRLLLENKELLEENVKLLEKTKEKRKRK